MKRSLRFAAVFVALTVLGACANQPPELIVSKKGAVELRAMQSRMFETGDRGKVFRAVIATFQDLGYSIKKLEPKAGTVSADKLSQIDMTATVYSRGENRTIVRSNAIVKLQPIAKTGHQVDSAEFYQKRFFEPLSKALFLTALQVEDENVPTKTDINSDSKGPPGPENGGASRSPQSP